MKTGSGSVARLLALGIVFHFVYIGTVFDCYFTSPVVHSMRQYKLPRAQAHRLVLIVGDGLRADFAFCSNASQIVPGTTERVAPYLRDIVENRGAYGVSHTHVPTPGHVAIIGVSLLAQTSAQLTHQSTAGGMYEDVSAVTKGWKTNPVDLDSVFSQSGHTFALGSPDVLPMFAQGATPGRVKEWSYHEDDEDFTKDATALDIWVLDQLDLLFRNATTNKLLDAQLRAPQVVFFLHLLGLDTTGHTYRPHSKEYMNNICVVDHVVREAERLISGFYGDQETSYIFTADHGMSRIGNHGDGDPDNTRTPLIAWGAGIRSPIRGPTFSQSLDDYPAPWELEHIVRRDVEQADVAAFMSTLLGTYWPVNSKGRREIAEAGVVNAKVLLEHYRVKHERKKAHAILYRPYEFLDHPLSFSEYPGSQRISFIEGLIGSGRFKEARRQSHELINATLGGLRYLETYDRTLIRTIIPFAYAGWIAYNALFILVPSHLPPSSSASFWIPLSFILMADLTRKVYANLSVFRGRKPDAKSIASTLLGLVLAVTTLQTMVFGYTHRAVWSIGFVAIGLDWPLISWPQSRGSLFQPLGSLLPPYSSLLFITLSILVTSDSVRSLQAKLGLPLVNQVAGWLIFAFAPLLPFFFPIPKTVEGRLLAYFLSFSPCFVILAIRTEGFFYLSYCMTLYLWTRVETALRQEKMKSGALASDKHMSMWNPMNLSRDDVRIALFFLFFVQAGFFGTGKSFYCEPVFWLVSIFSPFLMAALILFKLLAPFVFLSAAFATLNAHLGMPPFALFLVSLSLTDVMTVTFFFKVTDTGSLLEIGQSISHFCITSLLLVFSAGIAFIGEALMQGTVLGYPRRI
ncbi:Phosphatidylinositolglycan class N-domain-containing protein [Lactifluus volemus]|nr:Phosphatidylinositolglycan class N-domain-containing protein [Lactifluus volemus]